VSELNQLKTDLEAYLAVFKAVNVNFASVVANKDYPLEERWEIWKTAPIDLKVKKHCFGDFEFTNTLAEAMDSDWSWYDDYNIDRGQTVDMLKFVTEFEKGTGYSELQDLFNGRPDLLDVVKEEILQMNLASFTWDW
jgi:hypothetical protein